MSLFTCWPEGNERHCKTLSAGGYEEAALLFADMRGETKTITVVVADEKARRWLLRVHPRIEYGAEPGVPLGGPDIFASDPMPTPEAERIRDEMAGGAK